MIEFVPVRNNDNIQHQKLRNNIMTDLTRLMIDRVSQYMIFLLSIIKRRQALLYNTKYHLGHLNKNVPKI